MTDKRRPSVPAADPETKNAGITPGPSSSSTNESLSTFDSLKLQIRAQQEEEKIKVPSATNIFSIGLERLMKDNDANGNARREKEVELQDSIDRLKCLLAGKDVQLEELASTLESQNAQIAELEMKEARLQETLTDSDTRLQILVQDKQKLLQDNIEMLSEDLSLKQELSMYRFLLDQADKSFALKRSSDAAFQTDSASQDGVDDAPSKKGKPQ